MHVECVTNVVPTINDSEDELRLIAQWIATDLGAETPWHVTRFTPYLEFADLPATPVETLELARRIGREEGLRFVYLGNVAVRGGEDTLCPECGELAVDRVGYSTRVDALAPDGTCKRCGADLGIKLEGCRGVTG
jgi:pyruvate formate lyase activating enzyme